MRTSDLGLRDLIAVLPSGITMIEVGCFAGESTKMFLDSGKVKALFAVDAWQNGLDTTDAATVKYDLAVVEKWFDERLAFYSNVVKKKGDSLSLAAGFADSSVDFIYLDSCHEYEHVMKEISAYFPKVKFGGFIGGHDYGTYLGVTQAVCDVFDAPDELFADGSWIVRKK